MRRLGILVVGLVLAAGCGRKARQAEQYVYVTAKSANLRDRVAAVSNRTGAVANGDKLKVLEHSRHFVRVETSKGEVGWIEEKMVATAATEGEFDQLRDEHKNDPVVADGVVRDTVYMHLKPGKDSERFYLLPEGEKLKLLRRASLEKTNVNPSSVARAQKAIPQAAGTDAKKNKGPVAAPVVVAEAAAPAMEDWWLVRDSQGHTGWLYKGMMDVDAPADLQRYAENQRFVGAYVLTTVHDPEADGGARDVPIYVTVLSPFKAGLPYDFDQVRVFTWSLKKHRYETGYRDKNIEGYLPIVVGTMKDPGGKASNAGEMLPSFSYKVLAGDAAPPVPDAATGAVVPRKTITKTFRMEGNFMHRIGAAAGETEAHPVAEVKKEKKGKKR